MNLTIIRYGWRFLLGCVLVALGLALLTLPTPLHSQPGRVGADSLNMTLFGQLNPVDTAGPHAALWGWTAPDGREYALFGSQIGTHIIDITEQPIREVAFIPGPRNAWREMKTYKNYAYIVCEAHTEGKGLQIVDLSDLPNSARLIRTDTTNFISAHTIYINGHHLYVNGTQPEEGKANGGTIILDLEPDPTTPRRLGQVDPYYFHDSYARNDTLLGAAVYGQGCDIWNISDPAKPVRLANFNYPYSGTHNAELTPDGNYIGTSDEINFTPKTLKIWDIRDLNNIHKVAEFTPNLDDIIHNVHFIGRYAYVAWYTAGVRILDMIDPLHPREVAFYDTYPGPSNGYNGVWEVYGWFKSGKVIASDRNTGLWVMNFNNTTAGSISGIVRDAATNQPIANATITVPQLKLRLTTNADGAYYVGGVAGTAVTLTTARFPYSGSATQEVLNGDRKQDILLTKLPQEWITIRAQDQAGLAINDFAFAVEPVSRSEKAENGTGSLLLSRDSTFTLTVGRWGYRISRTEVKIPEGGKEVTVTLQPGYEDDATLDLGWSFDDPADNATTGRWVRIIPYLGYSNSGWIHPDAEPTRQNGYVFMTGAPPHDAPPQTNDVNRGQTTLTSPVMDLFGWSGVKIRYDRWFVHYPADSVRDSLWIELSNDGGQTWKLMRWFAEGRSGWAADTVEPGAYLPLTTQMKFRIRARDTLGNSLLFAAMDNFNVFITPSLAVPGGSKGAGIQLRATAAGVSLHAAEEYAGKKVSIDLVDLLGSVRQQLLEGVLSSAPQTLSLNPNLPPGWYAVRLRLDGELRCVEPVVIAR